MNVIINLLTIIAAIAGMEAMSWSVHKYLFHGPLWFIHASHHKQGASRFETNDLFSVFFAGISFYLMWEGRQSHNPGFWIGVGISIYGLIYFIIHDGFIHKRFKSFKTKNRYFLGIRRAHKIHHKSMDKNPSQEFGLLLASGKYFIRQRTDQATPNK